MELSVLFSATFATFTVKVVVFSSYVTVMGCVPAVYSMFGVHSNPVSIESFFPLL